MMSNVVANPGKRGDAETQYFSAPSVGTAAGEQGTEFKGAKAGVTAWAALTPEQQEARINEIRQQEERKAAAIAARFSRVPSLEDMRRLYEVAAKIAVIERWDVVTEGRADCHLSTVSDLLLEVSNIFADQDPQWSHDMSRFAELVGMDERALFEEWYQSRDDALRKLILFAERYLVLTWMSHPTVGFDRQAISEYDEARQAVAALGGVEYVQYGLYIEQLAE